MGRLVLLLAAPAGAVAAAGPTIVAVRVWPARDYTRVTIESDQVLEASHLLAQAPNRLVVDLNRLELSPELRELVGKIRPDDPYIAGVRVGQYLPRVVRLVLDLKQAVRPEQFTLAPVGAYRHRLVFDLFPMQEADPLLALIRESGRTRAVTVMQDALGELIDRIESPCRCRPRPRRRPCHAPPHAAEAVPTTPCCPHRHPTAPGTAHRGRTPAGGPVDHCRAGPRPWRRRPGRHRPHRSA
jgi:N-acetylmuramoyl-L-alanine amidase